jgi:DNA mismatch repair protein MutS2
MAGPVFKLGDEVRVKKLKQDGKIIEITTRGTYRVAIGALTIEQKAKELEPAPKDKYSGLTKKLKSKKFLVQGEITLEKMPEILDLHGLRVEEAMPKVSHFLDQAILNDKDCALILHGLGTGKLLEAVHRFLKQTPTVKRFELDPNNPGITRVYF